MKSEIENKLLQNGVFLANYGNLHFYVEGNETIDFVNLDINKINVVVVRQK